MRCIGSRAAILALGMGVVMARGLVAQSATSLGSFGTRGTADGEFYYPWDVCVDPAGGKVYVADNASLNRARVQRFSAAGAFELSWTILTRSNKVSLAWNKAASRLYVGPSSVREILSYAPDGSSPDVLLFDKSLQFPAQALAFRQATGDLYVAQLISQFNNTNSGLNVELYKASGQFLRPYSNENGSVANGIAVNEKTGDFYCALLGGSVVHRGPAGESREWKNNYPPPQGGGGEDFRGVAVDAAGNVYVSGQNRVLRFDANGAFQFAIGEGKLARPNGLAITPDGVLYVVENNSSSVSRWQIVEANGAPVVQINSPRSVATSASKLLIRGRAEDDGGVTKVTVRIGRSSFTATGTDKWRVRVPLRNGRQTIRVVATDTRGRKSAPKRIVVTRL